MSNVKKRGDICVLVQGPLLMLRRDTTDPKVEFVGRSAVADEPIPPMAEFSRVCFGFIRDLL